MIISMYKKLTFKSKQEVEHFIDEMFQKYSYETSFGSPLPNGINIVGDWVTIKLFNGFYHLLKGQNDEYIHYWTNGNTYDQEISYQDKKTLIKWLWEDRKYAYVSLPNLY